MKENKKVIFYTISYEMHIIHSFFFFIMQRM